MQETTRIYFVRHAEKEQVPGSDPQLTAAGKTRAEKLAETLKEEEISAIFSTPFKRTKSTAQPLSDLMDLDIREYDPRDFEVIDRIIAQNRGKTVLIVGHQINLPPMINSLLEEERVEAIAADEYDNIFLVEVSEESAKFSRSGY